MHQKRGNNRLILESSSPLKILVVGAGAMGCLFGGQLSRAGMSVTLVDVWREHIDAINLNGLRLVTNEGSQLIPVPACEAGQLTDPVDLLILFTKTVHSEKALESVAHLISPNTYALTLQNGLGNAEKIEKFISRERILLGVTNYPCDLEQPGHVVSLGSGLVRLYSVDGYEKPILTRIADEITRAGFNCKLDPEIERAIWEKVALNSAINAVTAVSRLTVGAVGDCEEGRALVLQIIAEVASVAKAAGIIIDEQSVCNTIIEAFSDHREHMPSMLQDLNAGRATEVNAINGAVLDIARRLNTDVPATETLYRLVRTIELSLVH